MRIHVPESEQGNPVGFMAQAYRPGLVQAGYNFSRATYVESQLTLREFEGARIRTAAINGCLVCQAWRSARDAVDYLRAFGAEKAKTVLERGPIPEEAFYTAVAEWRSSTLFSDRERIAIEYADKLGLDPHGLASDEDFWGRFKALYSDDEIVDLSHCIACWMGLGRVAHALGLDTVCQSEFAIGKDRAAA
jgi:alkylhydroperoxidase family enzyme